VLSIIHGTKDALVPFSNVAFMKKSFVAAQSIDTIVIDEKSFYSVESL
jgi:hypothetical protein